jgi:UDP-N-acetylglucosamine acyltransferase
VKGSWIGSHAVINSGARIGKNCRIFPGAVVSATPQDLKYNNEYTLTIIGDNTTIREYATISRGTEEHWKTVVGSDCLIMAYAHVAHDCRVGSNCIIGNNVQMAGHVHVGDWAIVSALSAVHQFVKIGIACICFRCFAGSEGCSAVYKSRPRAYLLCGYQLGRLERRGYSNEKIVDIQNIYRYIYMKGYNNAEALQKIELEMPPSNESGRDHQLYP